MTGSLKTTSRKDTREMVNIGEGPRPGVLEALASINVAQIDGDAAPPPGLAAHLYCERRRRDAWFGEGLFWDPAWDLLLYLYDACEGGRASVPIDRALQGSAAVSLASARRWIDLLVAEGLVAESARPGCGDQTRIGLTARGRAVMAGFLREAHGRATLP